MVNDLKSSINPGFAGVNFLPLNLYVKCCLFYFYTVFKRWINAFKNACVLIYKNIVSIFAGG